MAGGRGKKRSVGGRRRPGDVEITKKQRIHLKEFGELHPADVRETGREQYKKVEDVEDPVETKEQSESSSESEDEEVTSYQKLVSSISSKPRALAALTDSEEEEEEERYEGRAVEKDRTDMPTRQEGVKSDSAEDDTDESVKGLESEDLEESRQSEEEEKEGEEEGEDYRNEDHVSDDEEEEETLLKETDPFSIHFESELEESLAEKLADLKSWDRDEAKIPLLGKTMLSWPRGKTKPVFSQKEKDLRKLRVKLKLAEQVAETNKTLCQASLSDSEPLTPLQCSLFSVINNYQDLCYPERTDQNGEEIRLVYCLHALNHVLKTRSRVITHNMKIKSKKDEVPDDYRDQGLTRPKVLILTPFRESAYRIINMFISLAIPTDQSLVMNKKRFIEEFFEDNYMTKGRKPEDYEAMFSGNIDDHFRIGISISKKCLKLYSKFYGADIIVSSPLGLRTIIGAEGEGSRDFDYLSSIELLILDQTDVFLMQNWDHVTHILSHMHLQPKEGHGVDFSRVRMWTLNGWSKFYRQTLVFSGIATPEINAICNKHCLNYAGKVLVPKTHASGAICQIVTQLPQMFIRIESTNYTQLADARFNFFINKVLPDHKEAVMARTLIFIPSYFDFVRVRNYFKKEGLNFLAISEYVSEQKVRRFRSKFFHGKSHFLLVTERFHFFHRFKIRGACHLIFYELPRYPHFYSEVCNTLQDPRRHTEGENFTCHVIYSRYDTQRLSGLVGTDRAARMLTAEKNIHMFVTGDT